jgi:hypothetical protein
MTHSKRPVLLPLTEPVSIAKAMLAGETARVSGADGINYAVFLVNVQIHPWNKEKYGTTQYAEGFNAGASEMLAALQVFDEKFRPAPPAWKSMDSAPRTGQRFLAWHRGRAQFFHWQDSRNGTQPEGFRDDFIYVYAPGDPNGPECWMDAPEGPNKETE